MVFITNCITNDGFLCTKDFQLEMKRDHLCTRNPRGIYESLIEVLAAAPILVLVRGFRTYIPVIPSYTGYSVLETLYLFRGEFLEVNYFRGEFI
jgi:hypothetical protein